jgi:hypothetical protein
MNSSSTDDSALDPGATYRRRVSRVLWFRSPSARYRYLFAPGSPMGLFIEPPGKDGTAAFAAQIKALKAQGLAMHVGAVVVDDDNRFVFCGAGATLELLAQIARWARQRLSTMPAVANLIDAGVAAMAVELASDDAIAAIDVGRLAVQRDDDLWDGLLQATPQAVAEVLADRLPGDRMWFWLSGDVPEGVVPLLLQPLAWDPNRDRLDHLIEQVEAAGAGDGATGVCVFVDDGRLQFRGGALGASMLSALADWVRAEVGDAPALARLAGCQLCRTGDGKVVDVIQDDALWQGLTPPAAPGTLAEAADVLTRLAPGGEGWFWLTPSGQDGPFLTLAEAADDADGTRFQERVAGLFRRFPASFGDALSGVLRRLPDDRLVWSTEDDGVDAWPAAVRALVDAHGAAHPALQALTGSTLVQVAGGELSRTLAVGTA